jgi:6-phosphogluconolactonase
MGFDSRTIFLFLAMIAAALGEAGASPALTPRFAYVANGQDNTVSIFAIERAQLRALGYVYVGLHSNPVAVAVTPSQKFLYVASGRSGVYAYSIDASLGTLTPVPGSPFGTGQQFAVAVTASERILIAANSAAISTYFIDPASGVLTSGGSIASQKATSIAIDSQAPFIYAASRTGNSIAGFALDEETGTLTPLPNSANAAGTGPSAIAMDPFGKFLYVTNAGSANVSAYSIAAKTGALVEVSGSPFAAGSNPASAVLTSSGKFLFVGNSGEKTVSQYGIDRTSGALVSVASSFSTGPASPLGLAVNPREPLLYVADHDASEVRVLGITKAGVLFNESSIRSRGPATAVALASGASAITYVPRFVYESNAISNDIWGYQVSAGTGSIAEMNGSPFLTGAAPLAIVSDLAGRFIFTANSGEGSISAFTINSQTGVLTRAPGSPFPAAGQPRAIAVDANAHYLYAVDSGLNRISGFAISANGSLHPVPGSPFASKGTGPTGVTIDPRGKILYVANAGSGTLSVYQINARTGVLAYSGSTAAGGAPVAMAINAEGKYLFALDGSANKILGYAVDGVSGLVSRLPDAPYPGAGSPDSISVDPLGERVYTVGDATVNAYTLFGNIGRLKPLSGSPFGPVGAASSLTIGLSERFLWVSNRDDNNISGFMINRSTGSLAPVSAGPFAAGKGPSSLESVDGIE